MLKVYGTPTCPHCASAKANFDYYKIPYEYVDVCESVKQLKEFTVLRDTRKEFDDAKENGYIGIPAIIKEDGTLTFDWESIVKENGYEPIDISQGKACGIDGEGC